MRRMSITAPSSPPYRLLVSGLLAIVLLFAACAPAPKEPPPDPTAEPAYAGTIQRLATMNVEAREHFEAGRRGEAAELVNAGIPLSKELLGVSRPTLEAMQAASDLDQLYGDMLLSNRHTVYAREFYQRNAARWRNWRPQTEDTRRRLREANDAIARCDRELTKER